jgi:hypothetical protein
MCKLDMLLSPPCNAQTGSWAFGKRRMTWADQTRQRENQQPDPGVLSLITSDATGAPTTRSCVQLRYWSRNRPHPGFGFSSGSAFGPFAPRNSVARCEESPGSRIERRGDLSWRACAPALVRHDRPPRGLNLHRHLPPVRIEPAQSAATQSGIASERTRDVAQWEVRLDVAVCRLALGQSNVLMG